jgi:hypothetical protein
VSWTCVLALAATVAYAADRAIVASPLEAQPGAAATSAARVSDASAPIGSTVTLSSVDVEGTRTTIVCLTSPDRVKADVVAIEPEDVATVATNLCRPFPEMIIRPGDPY